METHQRGQRYGLAHLGSRNGLDDRGARAIALLFPLIDQSIQLRIIFTIGSDHEGGARMIGLCAHPTDQILGHIATHQNIFDDRVVIDVHRRG